MMKIYKTLKQKAELSNILSCPVMLSFRVRLSNSSVPFLRAPWEKYPVSSIGLSEAEAAEPQTARGQRYTACFKRSRDMKNMTVSLPTGALAFRWEMQPGNSRYMHELRWKHDLFCGTWLDLSNLDHISFHDSINRK